MIETKLFKSIIEQMQIWPPEWLSGKEMAFGLVGIEFKPHSGMNIEMWSQFTRINLQIYFSIGNQRDDLSHER